MATLNLDTIQTRTQELRNQANTIVDSARATGKTYLDVARHAIEAEAQDLLGRLREVETRGQHLLQERFGPQLEQAQKLEQEVRSRATKLADDIRPEIEQRLPVLAPVFARLEQAIRFVDGRLESVRQNVGSATVHTAIPNYDELNVKQITAKLSGLSPEELAAVREYENKHKKRVTVIREIDALAQ